MNGHHSRGAPVIMTAAFVLAQFCDISCADELGRLFTTPEERSFLDNLRNPSLAGTGPAPPAVAPGMAEPEPGNHAMAVKGFVYRKDGRSTVWISRSPLRTHGARDLQPRITTDASGAHDVLFDIPDGRAAIRVHPEKISHPQITE